MWRLLACRRSSANMRGLLFARWRLSAFAGGASISEPDRIRVALAAGAFFALSGEPPTRRPFRAILGLPIGSPAKEAASRVLAG
jgi:hypothetical protein